MSGQPLIMSQIDLEALADILADRLAARLTGGATENRQPATGFISRKEAAKYLNITLPTLHDLTRTGKVPAHRIGRRVLYKTSEIDSSLKMIKSIQ